MLNSFIVDWILTETRTGGASARDFFPAGLSTGTNRPPEKRNFNIGIASVSWTH